MSKISFDDEQLSVINSPLRVVSVSALAGSGKTTVLDGYADKNQSSSMLYCSFNKFIVDSSKLNKRKNVFCKTFHSLAYSIVGKKYSKKLKHKIELKDIISALYLPINDKSIYISRAVDDIIKGYTYSSSTNHKVFFKQKSEEYDNYKNIIYEYSCFIWEKMIDTGNKFPVTHDFYLKILQLAPQELFYERILFDEAQDGNAAMLSLLLNHVKSRNTEKKIVMVGDPSQSINSFRGSLNFFDEFTPSKTYYLNNSYRFGKNIASVVNDVLWSLGENRIINGVSKNDGIINPQSSSNKSVIIARSNATIFNRAIKLVESDEKIAFLGGIDSYGFELLRDIYYLKKNQRKRIISPYVLNFSSFPAIKDYAKTFSDRELLYFCHLVEKRDDIPKLINLIIEKSSSIKNAKFLLTTAHKSKGYEFENVILTNDYYSPFNNYGEKKARINKEELRVLYVAASRAKSTLEINTVIKDIQKYRKNDKILLENNEEEFFIDKINKK